MQPLEAPWSCEALRDAVQAGSPLLLPGAVAHWPACRLWAEPPSGLQRMRALVGAPAAVSVMSSRSNVFRGALHQVEPATLSFSDFLDEAERAAAGHPDAQHLYLAQQELGGSTGLAALLQDIDVPPCLVGRALSSTNLWMCIKGSRSNIHYDPYQNLLCVVAGSKTVSLYSPCCTPLLYPCPLTGDSANHSSVDFAAPDFTLHPGYRLALRERQEVVMQAGDALFIPEGYWHQIDSTAITVAVNFWWQSDITAALRQQPQSRFYHLRVVMGEALGSMVEQLVEAVPAASIDASATSEGAGSPAQLREAAAVRCLRRIVAGQPEQPRGEQQEQDGGAEAGLAALQVPSDQLSRLLRALSAGEMVRCVYELSRTHPALVRPLFDRMSPLAAYLFTSKLEAAEREGAFGAAAGANGGECSERSGPAGAGSGGGEGCPAAAGGLSAEDFYGSLYGASGDAEQVFQRLLALRQELTRQAAALLLQSVVGL